jgi:transposase, IS5 family
VPDESTLCWFRNRLIKHQRLEGLLAGIKEQLQEHGLMVKGASAAIVDATLIESAARPNKTIRLESDEAGAPILFEDGSQPGVKCEEQGSADRDAAWLRKGRNAYFGYRSYVVVDAKDGYVRGVHSAPANENEVKHFAAAVESAAMQAIRVYADKGSASAANRQWLRQRRIKSAIMHKAHKHKPLTERQKLANRLISKQRYRVEQTFGTLKRLFGMARARYFGTHKVNAQMVLKCLCLNLKKASNKISIALFPQGAVRPTTA